jgi:hypothetical protein
MLTLILLWKPTGIYGRACLLFHFWRRFYNWSSGSQAQLQGFHISGPPVIPICPIKKRVVLKGREWRLIMWEGHTAGRRR